MAKKAFRWQGKVGNHHQLGGIETSVLDNGPGRGVRIAWINTGTGLRYKVMIDRGMDIAEAFYNQHSLAWLSQGGMHAPSADANKGLEWLWAWPGGLVTTCGLTHMGAPREQGRYERHGLHGRYSNLPAEIVSIKQPDIWKANMDFSITGIVREMRMFGPNLELRRTISGRIGSPAIFIQDTVTNRGNCPAEHMLLYHCNFGWPLVDEGTDILWKGKCRTFARQGDEELFKDTRGRMKCKAPLKSHNGPGESCGLIDVPADRAGLCHVGLNNKKLGLAVGIVYNKKQMPYLTNWQHWGAGEYVNGLEPCTHPPMAPDGDDDLREPIRLGAGTSRRYDMEIKVMSEASDIEKFVAKALG